MGSNETCIVKTLAYADVFDYPLSSEELWRFLISDKKISKALVEKTLHTMADRVVVKNGLYCFSDRLHIITKRIERKKDNREKFRLAQRVIFYLCFVPTVRLIGISGALAMSNAEKLDDIDLFVITQKNTVWLTRMALMIILEILGVRRKRFQTQVENKVCLNMLIDESVLAFPKEKQNLYVAHEIVQMMPLFDRNKTYQKFMSANRWVKKFLPNSIEMKKLRDEEIKGKEVKLLNYLISKLLTLFDYFAKKIQLWYMKRHITNETITDTLLAFHPLDYKEVIRQKFEERMQKYGI